MNLTTWSPFCLKLPFGNRFNNYSYMVFKFMGHSKVSTPNCDISRSATPTLSTKPDTTCLQMGHSMFAIRTLVIKSNQW
jgi:hypothetical protein